MRNSSTYIGTFRKRVLGVALLFGVCAIFGSLPVHAAGQTRQEALPCNSETTTAGMRNCENLRYEQAQQALDSVYALLMKQLDAGGKEKLRAAQSAWLQFRQAEVDFEAQVGAGDSIAAFE
jgi:uncharacterized protein YecT (DUF1311 family)